MKCERGARSTVLAITNAPIRIHMELKCQDLGNNPLSWEIFRNNHYLPVKSGSCHHNVFIQVNLWYIFSNFVYNTSMDTSQIVHNRSYEHYKHFLCKEKVITKRLDRIPLQQQRARKVDTVCPQASQAGPKQKGGQGENKRSLRVLQMYTHNMCMYFSFRNNRGEDSFWLLRG